VCSATRLRCGFYQVQTLRSIWPSTKKFSGAYVCICATKFSDLGIFRTGTASFPFLCSFSSFSPTVAAAPRSPRRHSPRSRHRHSPRSRRRHSPRSPRRHSPRRHLPRSPPLCFPLWKNPNPNRPAPARRRSSTEQRRRAAHRREVAGGGAFASGLRSLRRPAPRRPRRRPCVQVRTPFAPPCLRGEGSSSAPTSLPSSCSPAVVPCSEHWHILFAI
jgi:hypothetical protein